MTTCNVNPIGTICNNDNGAWIEILPEYRPALQALDGFSHINVIWWFSECDNEAARAILEAEQPYKNAPGIMGIFATRSPAPPQSACTDCGRGTAVGFEKRYYKN